MMKRTISLLLALVMLVGMVPLKAEARSTIINPSGAKGSDYSSTYATKLDNVFGGTVALFSNTSDKFALGKSLNNSKEYLVAGALSGYQCYIYANAVYYYLFGDIPFRGGGLSGYWKDSKTVLQNQAKASYDSFVNADVGFGAYIRTTSNSDGSYNGNSGHSMILLSYDKSSITILEGNSDGKGLVRITIETWDEFNNSKVSGKGWRISHVVQCNSAVNSGVVDHVEKEYRCYGELTVTASTGTYVKSLPRSQDVDPNSKNVESGPAKKGDTYEAIGLVMNDAGNLWYRVLVNDKTTGYMYAGDVKYNHSMDDVGVSPDTTGPTEHKLGNPFNMTGTISAKYQNLVLVEARVTTMDGTYVTGDFHNVGTSSYKIPGSKLDTNTKFDTEITQEGTYYYTIEAVPESYYAKTAKEVGTAQSGRRSLFGQTFVVKKEVSCSHSYTSKVTAPTYAAQGYTTFTCSKCGYSYKGNYTDKLLREFSVSFDPNGGTLPAPTATNTLNGINVDRAVAYLVVYNTSGALVDTNKYGVEVLVDSTGKVTGKRDYLSETKQYVPTGGFVLSGQGENGSWVKEIPIGAYVAYDKATLQVFVYENREAMEANHKKVTDGKSIGILPTPTQAGYTFNGWYTATSGGTKITEDTTVTSDLKLYAQWVKGCATDHTYNAVVTKPTCTAQGYTTYTCTLCGYSYKGNTTNIIGHTYGQWTTVTAATCKAEGSEKRTCSACGDVQTQKIPVKPHSYVSQTVDATCKDYGKTVYTCSACGHSYEELNSTKYTDWSTEKPSGVDASLIESRKEYRYQTKEYTTSTSSTLPGWTQYNSTSSWGDYGSWSNWSDTKVTANDSTKVETRTVYKYYYYKCPSCGVHMHGWNITCPTWAGGCGKATIPDNYTVVWSTTSHDKAGFKDFHGTGKYYATVDGQQVFKPSNLESKTQYRYCTREQKTEYHFYKWSDWSAWGVSPVTENADTKVETRTVYRYLDAKLGDHNYTYNVTKKPTEFFTGVITGTCTACGSTVPEVMPTLNKTDYRYVVEKEPTHTETGIAKWTWNVNTYGEITIDTVLDKLELTLVSVEVKTAPNKTVYQMGEALDTTGLTLLARFSDGSTRTITDEFTVSGFDSTSAGEKTVTVTHGSKTTIFKVTVEKFAEPDHSTAKIIVGSKKASSGSTVELDVKIADNPGFSVLNIALLYDKQYLTLTEVKNQLPSMTMTSGSTIVWDAVENYNEDGSLCTLKFEIAENTPEGEYEIQVMFISASNDQFEEYNMSGVSGTLEIRNILYGDANGDGKIASVDLAMLRKYLASVDPITGTSSIAIKAGADCNGDGKIASVDLAMLRKYLASVDPITGESSVVLGPR